MTDAPPAADGRFGEVVEASTTHLLVQSHALYQAPPLGALVRAGEVFGVVDAIETGSLDPGRRVIARGADVTDEAALHAAHPQLERLLHTSVGITVTGFAAPDGVRHHLPPRPPRVHAFAHACDGDAGRAFATGDGGRFGFVSLLLAGPGGDEVLAAALRQLAGAFDDRRGFLLAVARAVAAEIPAQTGRVNALVRSLHLAEA
jgi:hypothetical protein